MQLDRQPLIRQLFEQYLQMYCSRDERLVHRFSENFTGYTGSSDLLAKNRNEWIKVMLQDFAQIPGHIRIEMLDLCLQDISEDVVAAMASFHIQLPIHDAILSHEAARQVVVFRREGGEWKIVHSGTSVPFGHAREGEIYPIANLQARNKELETLVAERTQALEEANKRLQALSNTDGLTGIANRRHFDRMLQQEWERGQRAKTPVAAIMLDVDIFKHFNDHYGHLAGDLCLQTLAVALSQTGGRRAGDLVARFGGEEFVVLMPDTSADAALEVAENILQQVRALALPHEGAPYGIVTVSLGVASMQPQRGQAAEDLVRQADLAMYRAKQAGRNCVVQAP